MGNVALAYNVLSLGLVADDSRPKPNKNTLIIKFKNNMDKNKTIPTLSQTTVMRWISTDEQLPMCYSTGNWDGKKSDNFIGETITGKQFLGCCYEGTMDGSKFFVWY